MACVLRAGTATSLRSGTLAGAWRLASAYRRDAGGVDVDPVEEARQKGLVTFGLEGPHVATEDCPVSLQRKGPGVPVLLAVKYEFDGWLRRAVLDERQLPSFDVQRLYRVGPNLYHAFHWTE